MAVYLRSKSLNNPFPSSAKHQREITKFSYYRTMEANFSFFHLNAGIGVELHYLA